MSDLLDQEVIDKKLEKLSDGWFQTGDNHLTASFDFSAFDEANEFVNCVAKIATKLDHHPSISWQYKTVVVSVTTHEVEGLSVKDFEFAEMVQECIKS